MAKPTHNNKSIFISTVLVHIKLDSDWIVNHVIITYSISDHLSAHCSILSLKIENIGRYIDRYLLYLTTVNDINREQFIELGNSSNYDFINNYFTIHCIF